MSRRLEFRGLVLGIIGSRVYGPEKYVEALVKLEHRGQCSVFRIQGPGFYSQFSPSLGSEIPPSPGLSQSATCPPLSRLQARLVSPWKQEAQYRVCVWSVHLLMATSGRGELFRYVPDHYLHTMVRNGTGWKDGGGGELVWHVSALVICKLQSIKKGETDNNYAIQDLELPQPDSLNASNTLNC